MSPSPSPSYIEHLFTPSSKEYNQNEILDEKTTIKTTTVFPSFSTNTKQQQQQQQQKKQKQQQPPKVIVQKIPQIINLPTKRVLSRTLDNGIKEREIKIVKLSPSPHQQQQSFNLPNNSNNNRVTIQLKNASNINGNGGKIQTKSGTFLINNKGKVTEGKNL